jgi:hypothetical protein
MEPLTLLTLVAALVGCGLGTLALWLGRQAPRGETALRGQYNADLKKLGELEVENAQLRIEVERQHETRTRQQREAQARDAHIADLYSALLAALPAAQQAAVLDWLKTPRPPALAPAPPAIRQISADAIRALVTILEPLPWLNTRDRRDAVLLTGLPPKFCGKIPRSESTQIDLINIFTMAFGYGADTFRMVLQNAIVDLNGSDPGQALKTWCVEWGFDPVVPHTP